MPFYRVEKYISSSIKSILNQTYTDFELILLNDGSDDRSGRIAEKFAEQDSRIVLVNNPVNMGIARSCNQALQMARGEFIVRSDSDDLALPDRLETQLAAATANPAVGVWGGGAYHLCGDREMLFLRESDPAVATAQMLFHIPLVNTTFFARRDVLDMVQPFYDPGVKFEDYDLLVRLAGLTQISNVREPVMKIRVNPRSFTYGLNGQDYLGQNLGCQEKLLRRLGVDFTTEELALHGEVVKYISHIRHESIYSDLPKVLPTRDEVRAWFAKIIVANARTRVFDRLVLTRMLGDIANYFKDNRRLEPAPWWGHLRWMERALRPLWH